jgi:outer membrane protein assembly factor BamB
MRIALALNTMQIVPRVRRPHRLIRQIRQNSTSVEVRPEMRSYLFRMTKRRWPAAALVAYVIIVLGALPARADAAQRLSEQEDARQLGLKRAWFAQVRLDPARNRVERAVLYGDRLSVLTTAGLMQEFDALSGRTVWIAPVGNADHPSLGPAASEKHVALLNGSTLFVLDRVDGRPIKVRPVGGAPGAAPALSATHAFVPLVTGRIEAYPLDEQVLTPWYYQSFGRGMVAPLATADSFVWATDSGHVYVGSLPELGVRYRLETGSEILAPPAHRRPFVYVATLDGEVFAMHELTGARRWKYGTGFPIIRAPAAVEDRVFVTSQEPALHCVDATKGVSLWEAPGIAQFAALSQERVYGVDELGGLVALDAKTGALLGRLPTDAATNALVNDQTDRIYLVSQNGVVQCLHELAAEEPLYHKPPTTDAPEPEEPAAPAEPAQPEPPPAEEPELGDEPSPFDDEADAGEPEMPDDESPFGAEDDDNPFDF